MIRQAFFLKIAYYFANISYKPILIVLTKYLGLSGGWAPERLDIHYIYSTSLPSTGKIAPKFLYRNTPNEPVIYC